jgi:hypothetical protein
VVEVEPAGSMGETELESGVELSVEEDDSLPAARVSHQSESPERNSRFSSPTKGVPVFKRTEELKKKQVFTPEMDMATRVKWAAKALENAGFNTGFPRCCLHHQFPG